MKLIDIIQQAADRMKNVRVDVRTNYGTVNIIDLTGVHESIFLQGDDATVFITNAEEAWHKAQHVTMSECFAWQAEQYVNNLWN